MSKFEMLSLDSYLFRAYLFYVSIMAIKLLALTPLTVYQRFKHKAFANPEDAEIRKLKPKVHEDVERVRRAHLNDLENIPIFFVVALIYLLTNPDPYITLWLFRAFTAARFIHTFVYAVVVTPQPARALSFGVGYFITGYMALKSAIYFF